MTESLPVIAYGVASGLGTLAAASLFVGSAVYDIQALRRRKHFMSFPGSRRYRQRPLVSVIIVVNHTNGLAASVDSVLKNSYRKHEIIIVDNGAGIDQTEIKVLKLKKVHMIVQPQKISYQAALETAYNASSGQIVAVLANGAKLIPTALKNAITQFLIDTQLDALSGQIVEPYKPTITNQIKQLAGLVRVRQAKLLSIFKRQHSNTLFSAYRRDVFLDKKQNFYYANDVLTYSISPLAMRRNGLTSSRFVFRVTNWLTCAGVILFISYVVYLALFLQIVDPLVIIVGGLTGFGLLLVLTDSHNKLSSKLRLVSLLPAWLVLAYLYALGRVLRPIQILARVRVRLSLAP